MATDSRERFEGVVREHSGRVLAALIGRFRDFQLAEDSLQDAWLLAAERWPVDGWPDRPEGTSCSNSDSTPSWQASWF